MRTDEHGYAMAALLVGISVMAVVMSMAMPVWSTAAKRAREDELVFRGEQYARAIGMYQRKYANALPPSIDVLVNERFLRRKYLDPITGGEFQALTGATGQAAAGQAAPGLPGASGAGRAGAQPGAGGAQPVGGAGAQSSFGGRGVAGGGAGQGRQAGTSVGGTSFGGGAAFGAAGGIVGVASRSTEKSLRLYNGRGAYNEWTFIAVQRSLQAGGGAAGAQAPGQGAAGRGGRGGDRGTGPGTAPNRPAGGAGSFRPPTGDNRGFRPSSGR